MDFNALLLYAIFGWLCIIFPAMIIAVGVVMTRQIDRERKSRLL